MIDVSLVDSFVAQWDVDARYYLWAIYKLINAGADSGKLILQRYPV